MNYRNVKTFQEQEKLPVRCCWNCRRKHVAMELLYCRRFPGIVMKAEYDPMQWYKCWREGQYPYILNMKDETIRKWKIFIIDSSGQYHFAGIVTGPSQIVKARGENVFTVWEKQNNQIAIDINYAVAHGVIKDFVPDPARRGAKD